MRRDKRSGFAMLFVLLMAGLVAIMLYKALPRAAFEAERDKEGTLVYRGEQYKRAIQLYVRQNKRWPAKIEDLENTNGKRYLRRRYVDPMTGKDEWRPVHVGPNGVLTDSLIKAKGKETGSTYSNNFITELGGVGALPEAGTGSVNPALRKRPSDQGPAGSGDAGGSSGGPVAGNFPVNGGPVPGQFGGIPGGASGLPTAPPGTLTPANGAPANGLPQQLQQLPGGPNAPAQSGNYGGISVLGGIGGGTGYSTAPGANGNAQPPAGAVPGGAPGSFNGGGGTPQGAQQLIQGLLTTPRPGGAPGTPIGQGTSGVQGGGIAGFASKFEGEGIKIYNEQTEIQKWEFVYDMSKDAMITGGQQAIPQPAGPNATNGQQPATNTNTSGFGQLNIPGSGGPTPPINPNGTVVK